MIEYGRKSNALNLCINNINNAKYQSIANLVDSSGTTEIDEITYSYTTQILPYKKGESVELSNARVIVSTVTYMLDGKENSVSLKCVKVENNI